MNKNERFIAAFEQVGFEVVCVGEEGNIIFWSIIKRSLSTTEGMRQVDHLSVILQHVAFIFMTNLMAYGHSRRNYCAAKEADG